MPSQACPWSTLYAGASATAYQKYHDLEWGVPVVPQSTGKSAVVDADRKLFEFLILELNQAGLSWSTILNKREGFRRVYGLSRSDSIRHVASWTEADVHRALGSTDIIRNRLKVEAAVCNATVVLELQKQYGSFCAFLWGLMPEKANSLCLPVVDGNIFQSMSDVPGKSALSNAVAKKLVQKGMRFVGSTTVYALLQSCGFLNDHLSNCPEREKCLQISADAVFLRAVDSARVKVSAEGWKAPRGNEGLHLPPNVEKAFSKEEAKKQTMKKVVKAVAKKSTMKKVVKAVAKSSTMKKMVKAVAKNSTMKKMVKADA